MSNEDALHEALRAEIIRHKKKIERLSKKIKEAESFRRELLKEINEAKKGGTKIGALQINGRR